jgi:hypothetical protein
MEESSRELILQILANEETLWLLLPRFYLMTAISTCLTKWVPIQEPTSGPLASHFSTCWMVYFLSVVTPASWIWILEIHWVIKWALGTITFQNLWIWANAPYNLSMPAYNTIINKGPIGFLWVKASILLKSTQRSMRLRMISNWTNTATVFTQNIFRANSISRMKWLDIIVKTKVLGYLDFPGF